MDKMKCNRNHNIIIKINYKKDYLLMMLSIIKKVLSVIWVVVAEWLKVNSSLPKNRNKSKMIQYYIVITLLIFKKILIIEDLHLNKWLKLLQKYN
jgi:hypothetical protein